MRWSRLSHVLPEHGRLSWGRHSKKGPKKESLKGGLGFPLVVEGWIPPKPYQKWQQQTFFRSSVAATLKRTACDALVLVHFLKFLKWLQCLPQHPVVLRLGRDCRLWNWNTSKASCRILHACMYEVSHFCNSGAVVFFNNWGHRPLWKCNKSYAHFPRKVHIAWGFCTPLTIVEVLGILKISPFILD